MNKTSINQRFIYTINFLIKDKKVKNKKEISDNLHCSQSKFSEILNNRMHASVEMIALLSQLYNISLDFIILGVDTLYKKENKDILSSSVTEPPPEYSQCKKCLEKDKIIELLTDNNNTKGKLIQNLEDKLDLIKKQNVVQGSSNISRKTG